MFRINLYIIIRDSPRAKPIRLVRLSLVVISLINPKQPASKVAVWPNTPITDLDTSYTFAKSWFYQRSRNSAGRSWRRRATMRTTTARVWPTRGSTISSLRPLVSLQGPGVKKGSMCGLLLSPHCYCCYYYATSLALLFVIMATLLLLLILLLPPCYYYYYTCQKAVDNSWHIHQNSLVDPNVRHNTLSFALNLFLMNLDFFF